MQSADGLRPELGRLFWITGVDRCADSNGCGTTLSGLASLHFFGWGRPLLPAFSPLKGEHMFSTRSSNTKLNLAIAAVTASPWPLLPSPRSPPVRHHTQQATGAASLTADQTVARISTNKGRITSKVRGEFGRDGTSAELPSRNGLRLRTARPSPPACCTQSSARQGNVIGTASKVIHHPGEKCLASHRWCYL